MSLNQLHLTHGLKDSKTAACREPGDVRATDSPKKYYFSFAIQFQLDISVFRVIYEVIDISQVTSGALRLAGLGELALQEHSGNTKPFLFVDRLSQDVVVRNRLEARVHKQLGKEL